MDALAERNGNLIPWAVTILAINLKIGNQAYNQSPESMLRVDLWRRDGQLLECWPRPRFRSQLSKDQTLSCESLLQVNVIFWRFLTASQLASCTFLTLPLLYNPSSHLLAENLGPRGLGSLPWAPLSSGQCPFHCTLWAVRVAQKLLGDLRPVMHSRRVGCCHWGHLSTPSQAQPTEIIFLLP